jgi:hypothetical protein
MSQHVNSHFEENNSAVTSSAARDLSWFRRQQIGEYPVAALLGMTGLVTFFRKLSIHAATAAELPRL